MTAPSNETNGSVSPLNLQYRHIRVLGPINPRHALSTVVDALDRLAKRNPAWAATLSVVFLGPSGGINGVNAHRHLGERAARWPFAMEIVGDGAAEMVARMKRLLRKKNRPGAAGSEAVFVFHTRTGALGHLAVATEWQGSPNIELKLPTGFIG